MGSFERSSDGYLSSYLASIRISSKLSKFQWNSGVFRFFVKFVKMLNVQFRFHNFRPETFWFFDKVFSHAISGALKRFFSWDMDDFLKNWFFGKIFRFLKKNTSPKNFTVSRKSFSPRLILKFRQLRHWGRIVNYWVLKFMPCFEIIQLWNDLF